MPIDLASGWVIRCPKCGEQKRLGEIGAIRLGAASRGKHTLCWCKECRRFRWAIIERAVGGAEPAPTSEGA